MAAGYQSWSCWLVVKEIFAVSLFWSNSQSWWLFFFENESWTFGVSCHEKVFERAIIRSFYLLQYHTNNLQMKKIILPKVHYSLEHLAHFIMGTTNNFCTWVQHCLVLLLVWVTWRDTNSCKQQSNQCPICYYGPLTWTYVATSFTLCQASAWGHESPRKGPIFRERKMKREKSCYGKKMAW